MTCNSIDVLRAYRIEGYIIFDYLLALCSTYTISQLFDINIIFAFFIVIIISMVANNYLCDVPTSLTTMRVPKNHQYQISVITPIPIPSITTPSTKVTPSTTPIPAVMDPEFNPALTVHIPIRPVIPTQTLESEPVILTQTSGSEPVISTQTSESEQE